ncbi:MAG: solute carrier family 25 phosphate transporter 23/24/25/41 [Bacillariaceae sp.]|jgi:solute carrier family 25 phosphate transporter 23/24/25/41
MGQQSNISGDRTQQQVEPSIYKKRTVEALKQLFCGGIAGSVAKTVTAPLSRLTILFQVHSMVTTRSNRPKFSMTLGGGMSKIIERGGIRSMWRGNMTSVLHRFPYSAINFFVYENILDELTGMRTDHKEKTETVTILARRMTHRIVGQEGENIINNNNSSVDIQKRKSLSSGEDTLASHKFLAGAMAGICAVSACYPLDLVKTRLTTQFEGREYYSGIRDAFRKIYKYEGVMGFYSGIGPTLLVAVPNFAISYSVYGTLKEYTLDDDLFYNLRKVDAESGEPKSGFFLTVLCGACSGCFATIITFPMDTIRRRMQIQNLHIDLEHRLTSRQQLMRLVKDEGLGSLYRGLKPELLKVIPMVGTMFLVYESSKDLLNVEHNR